MLFVDQRRMTSIFATLSVLPTHNGISLSLTKYFVKPFYGVFHDFTEFLPNNCQSYCNWFHTLCCKIFREINLRRIFSNGYSWKPCICYHFLYSWESICYIKNFSEFMYVKHLDFLLSWISCLHLFRIAFHFEFRCLFCKTI